MIHPQRKRKIGEVEIEEEESDARQKTEDKDNRPIIVKGQTDAEKNQIRKGRKQDHSQAFRCLGGEEIRPNSGDNEKNRHRKNFDNPGGDRTGQNVGHERALEPFF